MNLPKKLLLSSLGFAVLCTGCSWQSPRADKHKMELTLHKIRTEIEDLKHDLNTSDIELHILEGKLIDQEDTLVSVKEMINTSQEGKIDELQKLISSLSHKISSLEEFQNQVLTDLKQLSGHANETTTALSQYKDKIGEMERNIGFQNKKFDEISSLKKSLSLLVKNLESNPVKYTIKEGDSLQKISKNFSVTIDDIKQYNNLTTDKIFKGQELLIPKR